MKSVCLCDGHKEMNPSGPIHGVVNAPIKSIERGNFCFPERRIGVGKFGQCRGDSAWRTAVIIVTGDDARVGCHRRIFHGGEIIIGLPVLVFREHDFRRSHIAGHQGAVKIGGEIMNLLRSPHTGFVTGCNLWFVLNGDGVEIDAVRIFHRGHVTGQLTGISLVAGREKIAAIGGAVIAFERRLRTPWRAPHPGSAVLGHLHDAGFPSRAARRDAVAQQGKADAGVGGKKHVGLGSGPTGVPSRGSPETVNSLMHISPVHHAIGCHWRRAGKFDVVHPEARSAAQTRAVIRPINVNEDVVDVLQIGVAHRIDGKADMHPIGIAGRNIHAPKIVLAVADGCAKLQVAESIVHGGRTPGKADIALEICVLQAIHRRVDAIKVINLELTVAVCAGEASGDFHRTRTGVVAGVVRGIPDQRLKRASKPITPHICNLAAGVVVRASSRGVERVNHINSLCQDRRSESHDRE